MAERVNTAKRYTGTDKFGNAVEFWRVTAQRDGVRRSFTSFKAGKAGQREANEKADAWLEKGLHDGRKRVSLVWAEYLEHVKETSGTSNYEQISKFGLNYILPICGQRQIGKLQIGDLQDVLDKAYKGGCLRADAKKRSADGLSRKTLQGIRTAENSFIRWCRKKGYTDLRPEDDGLAVPKGARLKGKTILQPDALRVLESVDTTVHRGKRVRDDYILAYRFAVYTGLRPGELVGLQFGDVVGNKIHISRAINQYNEVTDGKNENAIRTFELDEKAAAVYAEQIEELKRSGVEINLTTRVFQISGQRSLYCKWKLYQESNNITPQISLYELRHTFVSDAAEKLSPREMKILLGHGEAMDTFGQYGHRVEGDDERIAKKISGTYSSDSEEA